MASRGRFLRRFWILSCIDVFIHITLPIFSFQCHTRSTLYPRSVVFSVVTQPSYPATPPHCYRTAVHAVLQIVRLVEGAQMAKAPIQTVADRLSSVFVPIVVVLAFATWLGWFLGGVCVCLVCR